MATRFWEPHAGAAHDPFTLTDLDARTAEVLARCRNLRARSRQLLAKAEDLRQSSAAAANRNREPQAGVATRGRQAAAAAKADPWPG